MPRAMAWMLLLLALQDPPEKGFVVVAPDRFHRALADYVAHKKKQLPTELASLEKILKSARGADDAEKLKRWLFDAWKDRKIGYALLVGDADVLPVRYMVLDRITAPAFDYAFYPSDLYYGDVARADGTFEDWNAAKDGFHAGYFGEVRGEKIKTDPVNYDVVHYKPELAVGRWPVSDADDVALVSAKTIAYETGAPKRKAAFVCVEGWEDTRKKLDGFADGLPKGWSAEKLYYGGKTAAPNEEEVVKLLNAGLGLIAHTGHGSDDSWAGCISTASIDKMKNDGALPVMISIGCSTARFATLPPYEPYTDADGQAHAGTNDGKETFKEPPPPPACYQTGRHNPTGFGEQLLRKGKTGAVAYIGCNTGSQPCGLTLLEGFMDGLAKSKAPRLGDVWAHAVTHYYDAEKLADLKPDDGWYPPSIFFQGMKFMLFGDPTLRMPTTR